MNRSPSRSNILVAASCVGLILGSLPGEARADVLHLSGGGRLEGILIEESPARVTLEVSTGRVTLPRATVVRIERTESALATFRARLATLPSGDLEALVDLARFASAHGLSSEARDAWTSVLTLDPANAEGHRALGHVVFAGSWMERDEAFRAQGLVSFEGRWMTPAEQESLLRDRERRGDDDRRVAEARRATREAEERARRAEAEAERARSEAARATANSPWGYGGRVLVAGPVWAGGGSGCLRLPCDHEASKPAPSPTPAPRPAPPSVRPSSIR